MNLKVIINSLLLIVVLHLFLQNLNYEVNIGESSKRENFEVNNIKENMNNGRDSLLEYLNTESNEPNPSNSNLENNSIPNFNGENQDLSQFFNIYDNLDEKNLSESVKKMNDYEDSQNYLEKTNTLEQQWQYNGEMPMNGGTMGNENVVGFDSLDGNYASINFNDDVSKENNITDLRNGMMQKNEN